MFRGLNEISRTNKRPASFHMLCLQWKICLTLCPYSSCPDLLTGQYICIVSFSSITNGFLQSAGLRLALMLAPDKKGTWTSSARSHETKQCDIGPKFLGIITSNCAELCLSFKESVATTKTAKSAPVQEIMAKEKSSHRSLLANSELEFLVFCAEDAEHSHQIHYYLHNKATCN